MGAQIPTEHSTNRALKIFVFGLLAILLSAQVFAIPESDGVIADPNQPGRPSGEKFEELINEFNAEVQNREREENKQAAELNAASNAQQQPPPAEDAPQTQDDGSGDTVAEAPVVAEPEAASDETSESPDESEESADESEDSTADGVGSDDEDSTDEQRKTGIFN